MKNMVIIITALLLYSCGTTKKMTQTETHSKVNIESSFVDTSKKFESWEVIVNSAVKEIDLGKIQITTYYPEKDSSGKQPIKEIIEINTIKSILTSSNSIQSKNEIIKSFIVKDYNLTEEVNENVKISDFKKKKLSCKYLFIIALTLFIMLWLLNIFKNK